MTLYFKFWDHHYIFEMDRATQHSK